MMASRFAASGDRRRARIDWPPDLVDELPAELPRLPFAEVVEQIDRPDLKTGILEGMQSSRPGKVAIAAAGTSDQRVATEAARTLEFSGVDAEVFVDIGVAGLWRLEARLPELRAADIVIVVAGMGWLWSRSWVVLSARRSSVCRRRSVTAWRRLGGTQQRGELCAVYVVNIDNGFGAACAAVRMLSLLGRTDPARDDRVVRRWGRSERRHVARRLRRRRCAARGAVGVDQGTRPRRHAAFRAGPAAGLDATRIHVEVPDSTVVRHLPDILELFAQLDAGVRTIATAFSSASPTPKLGCTAPRSTRSTSTRWEHSTRSPTSSVARALCTSGLTSPLFGSEPRRFDPGTRTHPDPGARRARVLTGVAPMQAGPAPFEATPTGAAVLATIVGLVSDAADDCHGGGQGAGGRDSDQVANVLRLVRQPGLTPARPQPVATRARRPSRKSSTVIEAGVVITSAEGVGGLERDEPVE